MYEYNTRIRYSEIEENGRIRLLSLLNYLQDTSTQHSRECGMTTEHYLESKRAWFINFWDIYIDKLPVEGQKIIAGTCPRDSKGIFAFRNFWLKDEATKDYLLRADSMWFLVNTETLRPIKHGPEDIGPFGELRDVLGIETRSRKIELPSKEEMKQIDQTKVIYQMLDTNHHVNNIRYIDIAYQAMIHGGVKDRTFFPSHIRAEYKLAACLDDEIFVYHTETEDKHLLCLSNESGKDFCIIEFS